MRLRLKDPVIYVDPFGVARGAILNTIWGQSRPTDNVVLENGQVIETDELAPSVNLAFTSGDENRKDNAGYGRQIERASSCVHMTNQSAHGNYWRRLEEVGKTTER